MNWKLRGSITGIIRMLIVYTGIVVLWLFFRSYLLFLGMVFVPVLAALSVICLWKQRKSFQLYVKLPEQRVGRNALLKLELFLKYPGKICCFTADVVIQVRNLFTGCEKERKEHLLMRPGHGACRIYRMDSRNVGLLEARGDSFVVYDFFHIAGLMGCKATAAQLFVWPSASAAEEEKLSRSIEGFPEEENIAKQGTDYNPDYEVREYRTGDELKNIHWKLSARRQEYVVKERLHSGKNRVNVVLDLGPQEKENDDLMDALYEVCSRLIKKDFPVQLYWINSKGNLESRFFCESGEMEQALSEILSDNGIRMEKEAIVKMREEHPAESFVYVKTGAFKGEYIS